MKRPLQKMQGVSFGDITQNLSANQLSAIGAIALAYNQCEAFLHSIVSQVVQYPGNGHELTSRVGGSDGLVAIALDAAKARNLPTDVLEALSSALQSTGFKYLKTLRDAVMHSRVFNATESIAVSLGRQGKKDEVALSYENLVWLYQSLQHLANEMQSLSGAVGYATRLLVPPAPDDQNKEQLSEWISVGLARCQHYRTARLALKQPPGFPKEPRTLVLPTPKRPDRWVP